LECGSRKKGKEGALKFEFGMMKKFKPDQMIFTLILGAVILGLTIYRYFYIF